MTDEEYIRQVIIQAHGIANESDELAEDMGGEGVEADIRRDAFMAVIKDSLDNSVVLLLKALRIAEITPLQAARFLVARQALAEIIK